ncbi:uncharacterized protein LOC122970175 [Scomber scombrus]|uniref:Uncharacterized protein LOC122970175 n=1 Tax=Scomber scombrus TaxID=13677 RepID=A0AAV1MSZ4_SCOSC
MESAEKLCTSLETRYNAVLERMGLSKQKPLPSPQAPASPRRNPGSSLRGRRIRNVLEPPSNLDELWNDEDPFFEEKLHLGSEAAVIACKLAKLEARNLSPVTSICSVDSLSSVDTHTPSELRCLSQIETPIPSPFTPTPPPTAAPLSRRASRLPVMSANLSGAFKEIADGCKLQTYRAVPTKRREPRRGTNLRLQKPHRGACQEELQPLDKPTESLSLCFKQLESDDWVKKMEGLKSIQALARHHPQVLQTKLHDVCQALTEEVNNLRSNVACAAMDTIRDLHLHLGKEMDSMVETTGRVLLLKLAQTTATFIHKQANLALDALVEGCSPSRVITALLNTGLRHLCAAVRGSTAQHLRQLADIVGEDRILSAGKTFAERYLFAVCKMSVDAAPEVRHYGHMMLQGLVQKREFMGLWKRVIPVKDRPPLEKILKKMQR